MKNKTYITPHVRQEAAECCTMIALSGVNSNNGIEYGGVDKYGDEEPAVKEFLWNEE